MKINKNDIEKIIEQLKIKQEELKSGEYFEINGNELLHKKERKILPSQWSVRITKENIDILANRRKDGVNSGIRSNHINAIGGFISNFRNHIGYYSETRDSDYPEIDFEEYKECLMK